MTPATLKALQEFRSDKTKVVALRKVLDMPIMVEATEILERTSPSHSGVYSQVSKQQNSVFLGNVLGYTLRGDRLKDLATHIKITPIVVDDYAEGN